MPGIKWFEGAQVNYAEHIFRNKSKDYPALISRTEREIEVVYSWDRLEKEVASVAAWLREQGISTGDRVVAYVPNIPQATIAFLATNAIGAVWSSCSPDFGSASVLERFKQIDPKILFYVDGYTYQGKAINKEKEVAEIMEELPGLKASVEISFLDPLSKATHRTFSWNDVSRDTVQKLEFERVPFDHPIWVLYSSGTTGAPKPITHSHGGMLLEHLKYLTFHNDVKPGERFFWFTTTGWMMWNYVHASLLAGATIVLYEGSPGYPDMKVLWKMASELQIVHFGVSAPFLVASMKAGLAPGVEFDLKALRSIGSTGSPLPPEAFDWIYSAVKRDLWLCSISGGTDVCTAFVGGVPTEPVYKGEIQRRALGCSLYAFNEKGEAVTGEVGELVVTKPMPCMPIYFWNDPDNQRYKQSYFSMYDGIWRHGDWIKITDRHTVVIYGRSDATLNRQGVRIGTAEIYRSLDKLKEIKDSLIVHLDLQGGNHLMPLFVVMNEGYHLDDQLVRLIKKTLRQDYSPRHVPDEVIEVPDIPYTISGKKLEAPVKKILLGSAIETVANPGALRNPASLKVFEKMRDKIGLLGR